MVRVFKFQENGIAIQVMLWHGAHGISHFDTFKQAEHFLKTTGRKGTWQLTKYDKNDRPYLERTLTIQ